MTTCDYCHNPLPNPKPGQRFCSGPGATCRQKWHKEQGTLPGKVDRITKRRDGKYTITIHLPGAPTFNKGDNVQIQIKPRPDASQSNETGAPEQ